MFTHLKQHWSQLRHAPPGERFERRYRASHGQGSRRSILRRVLLVVLAVALTAVGIVLMFIPGPAILFFFLAGAIFAEESRWVARLLDRLEVRLRRIWHALQQWWRRSSFATRGLALTAITCAAAGSAYLTYRMLA